MPRQKQPMSAETQWTIQGYLHEIGALCAEVFTPTRVTLLVRHPTTGTDFLFVSEDDLGAVLHRLTLIQEERAAGEHLS
jgi:hypothetical protein